MDFKDHSGCFNLGRKEQLVWSKHWWLEVRLTMGFQGKLRFSNLRTASLERTPLARNSRWSWTQIPQRRPWGPPQIPHCRHNHSRPLGIPSSDFCRINASLAMLYYQNCFSSRQTGIYYKTSAEFASLRKTNWLTTVTQSIAAVLINQLESTYGDNQQ